MAKMVYLDERKPDVLLEILDWLKYILIAVLLGLLMVVFVIQRNTVNGSSMEPTLQNEDQLLVEKVSKYFQGINYGDIITIDTKKVAQHQGDKIDIVKRVIGRPGDTIEIRTNGVFRNSQIIDESAYLPTGTITGIGDLQYAKVTLGADEYYVMGDNREYSEDSRYFGPIKLDSVIGEVLLRIYPFEDFGKP